MAAERGTPARSRLRTAAKNPWLKGHNARAFLLHVPVYCRIANNPFRRELDFTRLTVEPHTVTFSSPNRYLNVTTCPDPKAPGGRWPTYF
jgi:hypothetical protein